MLPDNAVCLVLIFVCVQHGSLPVMRRRCSTVELELVSLDKVHIEGELVSSIPQETSCFIASANSSTAGPGLDSDFGASAGEFIHKYTVFLRFCHAVKLGISPLESFEFSGSKVF